MATKKPVARKTPAKKTVAKKTTKKVEKTAKEIATENKEPWVNILSIELDPENVGNGAIELDWNEYFIAKLVKSGYMVDKNDTDSVIVDRWFQDVCRNVVLETYEQYDANYATQRRVVGINDLGGGRSEVS